MNNRFTRRVALVTGAAGDIGQATAVRLTSEGAAVAVADRRIELLDETVRQCREAGGSVLAIGMDQTDRDQVESGVAAAVDELGPIDLLFANAGYGKFATFLEQPAKEWDRHVAVNLTGTFTVCQTVARGMVERRAGGAIVINASSGAVQHTDLLSAYCSTKAALRMLAIGMASELGNHRIRVNTVLPGVIRTGMTGPMLDGPDGAAHLAALLEDTPAGRLGEPEDIAALVAFLLSDEASYITGESVSVDGGQTILGHPRWYSTDHRRAHEEFWKAGR
jgi:NAD(P)-dependent dehydrogenase (short-subunit alcohol dehydrogenase family)